MKIKLLLPTIIILAGTVIWLIAQKTSLPAIVKEFSEHHVGEAIDSFNGVKVYYNGAISHVSERNLAADGYNIGLKYQCVEFVKRYYYERFNHEMPDSYGNAKDFFDESVIDSALNKKRNLVQYTNGSKWRPAAEDLIIFDGSAFNQYGHVAIITKVSDDSIEIIQQNPGPAARSRISLPLTNEHGKWKVENDRALGWLRKQS